MGEFQRDHLRPNQTILDQLIDQLAKEQTAAAGPPTTPARTETQRKARKIAYHRTLAALEKRLEEVRAAHAELKDREAAMRANISDVERPLLAARQLCAELEQQIDDLPHLNPQHRRRRRRTRPRTDRHRDRHTIYSLGLHASKIRSIISNGVSDYGWSKLSSREAWELYKQANRQLYARLTTYLDGHLPECQDNIKIGDGIALWRNIVGAHFYPDHTLAAARRKLWFDTKQDDCPGGWENIEQFVTRLRKINRMYLAVCVRDLNGKPPQRLDTKFNLLVKLRNDTAERYAPKRVRIEDREYDLDGTPATYEVYLKGLNTFERRRIAQEDPKFDRHDRRRKAGPPKRVGRDRQRSRSAHAASDSEAHDQVDPNAPCHIHVGAPHTNGECKAQARARRRKVPRGGDRKAQDAANAVRPGVEVPPPPPAGSKNVQHVRRLTPQEFEFCKNHNMCMRCGSIGHMARDCTASKEQVDSFYADGLSNLMADKTWDWPGRKAEAGNQAEAGMAGANPLDNLAEALVKILSGEDEAASATSQPDHVQLPSDDVDTREDDLHLGAIATLDADLLNDDDAFERAIQQLTLNLRTAQGLQDETHVVISDQQAGPLPHLREHSRQGKHEDTGHCTPAFHRLAKALNELLPSSEAAQVEENKSRPDPSHPGGPRDEERELRQEETSNEEDSLMGIAHGSNGRASASKAPVPSKPDPNSPAGEVWLPGNSFKRGSPWTTYEDQVLLSLCQRGASPRVLSEHLPGRSRGSASERLRHLDRQAGRRVRTLGHGGRHSINYRQPHALTAPALAPLTSSTTPALAPQTLSKPLKSSNSSRSPGKRRERWPSRPNTNAERRRRRDHQHSQSQSRATRDGQRRPSMAWTTPSRTATGPYPAGHRAGSARSRQHSRPSARTKRRSVRPKGGWNEGRGPPSHLPSHHERLSARQTQKNSWRLRAVINELTRMNRKLSKLDRPGPRWIQPQERAGQSLTINVNGAPSVPSCTRALAMGGHHWSGPSRGQGLMNRLDHLSREVRDIQMTMRHGNLQ